MRRQVEQGLSVYRIDTPVLERLQPDLVLTQDQCEVCAVSLGDVTAAVSGVVRQPANVVSLSPLSLGAVFESVLTVARALGAEKRGRDLVGQMKGRLAATAAAVAAGPPSAARGPRGVDRAPHGGRALDTRARGGGGGRAPPRRSRWIQPTGSLEGGPRV